MDVTVLKIILLVVMLIVSLITGLIPFALYRFFTDKNKKASKYGNLAISLMSCFAGGVILSVCLLHILPDAMEQYQDLQEDAQWKPHYPFLTFFIGVGFFVVYLSEVIIEGWCGHSHGGELFHDEQLNNNLPDLQIPHLHENEQRRTTAKGITAAITFVLALLIHNFLEGFAFGIQGTTFSLSSLFFGIIIHKGLVLFATGLTFVDTLPDRRRLGMALIVLLSFFSPIGGVIGILVQNSAMEQVPKEIVTTILTCFSIGCFLFITFFDILSTERAKSHSNALQYVSTLAGFCAIAIVFIFTTD